MRLLALSRTESLALLGIGVWVVGAGFAGRAGIWSSMGGAAVLVAAAALAFDRDVRRLLPPPRLAALAWGCLAGVAMAAATILLYPIVAQAFVRIVRDTADLYTAFGHLPRAGAALLLVPIVIGEEVIWRGLVQGAIAGRIRRAERQAQQEAQPIQARSKRQPTPRVALALAVLPAAALYALAMAPTGSPVLVLAAFAGGIVWGAVRAHTGDLVAPITAHLLWNAIVLFLRPLV
ncbi:MAG TPA: CPBP family intramembrane glutamic endopeptidase [Polyangia bacterium]